MSFWCCILVGKPLLRFAAWEPAPCHVSHLGSGEQHKEQTAYRTQDIDTKMDQGFISRSHPRRGETKVRTKKNPYSAVYWFNPKKNCGTKNEPNRWPLGSWFMVGFKRAFSLWNIFLGGGNKNWSVLSDPACRLKPNRRVQRGQQTEWSKMLDGIRKLGKNKGRH